MKSLHIFLILTLFLPLVTEAKRNFLLFDFKNLSQKQKVQALKDFRIFVEDYERKHSEFLKTSSHFFKLSLIPEAYAAGGDSCLYGGWLSITDANGFCFRPSEKSESYPQYEGKCSSSQLYCNPTLFGHDICVDFSSRESRRSAYKNCNQKFMETGKTLEELADSVNDDEMLSLANEVDEVCSSGRRQSTTAMCASIKQKMNAYLSADEDISSEMIAEVLSTPNLNHKNIRNAYSTSSTRLESLASEIEEKCQENPLTEEKSLECEKLANEFLEVDENLGLLMERVEAEDASLFNKLNNSQCKKIAHITEVEQLSETVEEATAKLSCTQADKNLKAKNCRKEQMCVMMSSISLISAFLPKSKSNCINGDNNCLVEALKGIVRSITDLLTGVWDLLKMAGKWVADKAGEFWNWVKGAEDASSDKAMIAASLSQSDVAEIEKDGGESWLKKLWNAIAQSFDDFIKKDVFCQEWSGVSHFSECTKPMKEWSCLSCGTQIKGVCMAAGYLVPEIVGIIFSGGTSALIKGGVKGAVLAAKGTKAAAKLSKLAAKASKNPALRSLGKVASKGGKLVGKPLKKISYVTKETSKGFKWLKNQPHILKAREIASKLKTRVGDIKLAKYYNKMQKQGNSVLRNTGKKLEERGRRYGESKANEMAVKSKVISSGKVLEKGNGSMEALSKKERGRNTFPKISLTKKVDQAKKKIKKVIKDKKLKRQERIADRRLKKKRSRKPKESIFKLLKVERDYYGSPGSPWVQYKGANYDIPIQGFKLHVSAQYYNYDQIAEIIVPILKNNKVHHKISPSLDHFKLLSGSETQRAKFVTIYPKNVEHAKEIAKEIDKAFVKNKMSKEDFMYVAGEKELGKAGGVFARYGQIKSNGFVEKVFRANDEGFIVMKDGKKYSYKGKNINVNDDDPFSIFNEVDKKNIFEDFNKEDIILDDGRGAYKPDWVKDPFEELE